MAQTHDYTKRSWGHNYEITSIQNDGLNLNMFGWGLGIKKGDFIILKNGSDTTRYCFGDISYYNDPHDMWTSNLKFKPRD